jgi:hypothetical protein
MGAPLGAPVAPSRFGAVLPWLLGAAAVGAIWYLLRGRRFTPNRATSARAKAALGRYAERDQVRRIREDYDAQVRALRGKQRRVRSKVTKACEKTRRAASDEVREMRERERERINRRADAIRAKAKKRCATRRARVQDAVTAGLAVAAEERDSRIRRAKQLGAAERKRAAKLAASEERRAKREREQESDDAVEANIDAELIPVWRQVKREIRGTPKMSRTEAFLHWVGENENEMWAMREQAIAEELDDLAAEQAAYYAEQPPPSYLEAPF